MYGIDSNEPYNKLIDAELLQISIGEYQLSLNFGNDIAIHIECDLTVHPVGHMSQIVSIDEREYPKSLYSLLGEKISDIDLSNQGNLLLSFTNGIKLNIIDSNENTESFTIQIGQTEIIV